jgi:hypothetical protein
MHTGSRVSLHRAGSVLLCLVEKFIVVAQFISNFTKQRGHYFFIATTIAGLTTAIVLLLLLRSLHGPDELFKSMRILKTSQSKFLASIRSRTSRINIDHSENIGDTEARIPCRLGDIAIGNLIKRYYSISRKRQVSEYSKYHLLYIGKMSDSQSHYDVPVLLLFP